MKEPLVSIIVPVYNVSEYLQQCLDSIISQTYKNLEIILIDDGSTDDSGKICDEYTSTDHRIRVIHKKNGGVSSARNVGLENMTGQLVCFIDADDIVQITYIQYLYNLISTHNADISVCSYTKIKRNDVVNFVDINSNEYQVFSKEEAIENMLYKKQISTYCYTKMFNSVAVQNIFFQENLKVGEDFDFVIRVMSNVKKIVYGNCSLYFYIQNSTSCMHGTDWNKYREFIINLQTIYENFDTKQDQLEDAYRNFEFVGALAFYAMSTEWDGAEDFKRELLCIIRKNAKFVAHNKKGKDIHILLGKICMASPKLGAEICRLFIDTSRHLKIQLKKAV